MLLPIPAKGRTEVGKFQFSRAEWRLLGRIWLLAPAAAQSAAPGDLGLCWLEVARGYEPLGPAEGP